MSGQRVGGSVLVWSWSWTGLYAGQSRFVGIEAIVVKDVVMSGQIASDLVFMA